MRQSYKEEKAGSYTVTCWSCGRSCPNRESRRHRPSRWAATIGSRSVRVVCTGMREHQPCISTSGMRGWLAAKDADARHRPAASSGTQVGGARHVGQPLATTAPANSLDSCHSMARQPAAYGALCLTRRPYSRYTLVHHRCSMPPSSAAMLPHSALSVLPGCPCPLTKPVSCTADGD